MTEKRETKDQPEKRGPGRPPKSKLSKFLELAEELGEEERQELMRMGCVPPSKDIELAAKGEYHWGIRCTNCNGVAIYFVGKEWKDLNGEPMEHPPAYLTIDQILWTQDAPPERIDRSNPKCPHCSYVVPLSPTRGFRHDRDRLVKISKFEASRKINHTRKAKELYRDIKDGGASGGSSNYDKQFPRNISDQLPPEQREALQQLDPILTDALAQLRGR